MAIDCFPAGTVFNDNYEVLGPLGRGGFATVLRVQDRAENRVVALKLTTEIGETETRFAKEIEVLQRLRIPGVITILDFELLHNPPYYVMPLAETTLEERGDDIRKDEQTIINVFKRICTPLVLVHAQGIFHRDLKPSNVLIVNDQIVLADFGLAKTAPAESTGLTQTALGSVEWCAPEQLTTAGTKDADARTDVYQLGKILYWLYTGSSPFSPDLAKLPDGIRHIVAAATASLKADRFQNVKDLIHSVDVYEQMVSGRGTSSAPPNPAWPAVPNLTTSQMVQRIKEYLPEEKHRIRLHDLVIGEAERVRQQCSGERFSFLAPCRIPSDMVPRLANYDAELESLLGMLTAGGYWGMKVHRQLWDQAFDRTARPTENLGGDQNWRILALYPLALLFYGFGIAALAVRNHGTIAHLFMRSQVVFASKERRLLELLGDVDNRVLWQKVVAMTPEVGQRNVIPFSTYLATRLRPALRELLPTEQQFQQAMDRFEYLYALVYGDYYQHERPGRTDIWAPIGLHARRHRTIISEVQIEIEAKRERWPLLRAGLFSGNVDRLLEVKKGVDALITGFAHSNGWY